MITKLVRPLSRLSTARALIGLRSGHFNWQSPAYLLVLSLRSSFLVLSFSYALRKIALYFAERTISSELHHFPDKSYETMAVAPGADGKYIGMIQTEARFISRYSHTVA